MIGKFRAGMRPVLALAATAAAAIALTGPGRTAVMTTNVAVSGAGPYTISYKLAQTAITLNVKIFNAAGTLVRTITSTDSTQMDAGSHSTTTGDLTPVEWDGKKDDGTNAPGGTYYVEVVTTGDAVASPNQLGVGTFARPAGISDGRTVYNGDVNRNPASPLHNMAYFGISNTSGSGFSGVDAVSADATSIPFVQDGASGAYDYCAASVLSDETLLLGGQGKKKLRNVKATDGSLIADYAAGKIDVRGMQAFGSGPNARVYFVDDQTPNGPLTGSVSLLNPISNTTGTPIYQTVITQDQIRTAAGIATTAYPGTRGVVVNRAETSIWICGQQANTSGIHFILRFDKVGGQWQQNTSFIASPETTARMGGLALSPDEKTLWVPFANPNDATTSHVVGMDSATGITLGSDYDWFPNVAPGGPNADFQPVVVSTTASDSNNNAQTSYNLVVAGFRTFPAAVSTANSVAIVAPKDNGSHDATRSTFFDVISGATSVSITSGPTVTNITANGATITWGTDFISDSTLRTGAAAGTYDREISSTITTTQHTVTLSDLAPGTTYYFQVESKRDPLSPAQATGVFTTTPILRVVSETFSATANTATLNFTTNVAGSAIIHWGDNATTFNKPDINIPSGTAHTAAFSGLAPGITYYYQIVLSSPDAVGATTRTSSFTTASTTGTAGTVTDNKLNAAHMVDLVTSGGAATLPVQGIPNAPQIVATLPQAISDAGVTAYNGYLYAIGGTDTNGLALTTVYYIKINPDGTLDPNGWQTGSKPLPAARSSIGNMVTAYNGFIYVVGGLDGSDPAVPQASVLCAPQQANGDLGDWLGLNPDGTPVNPMPQPRYRGSARIADGYLLVTRGYTTGGVAQGTDYSTTFMADGMVGPWSTSGANDGRALHSTVVNNHTVYLIGGDNASAIPVISTDVAPVQPNGEPAGYTPVIAYPGHTDNTFDVNAGRRGAAAAMLGGKLVTAGGTLRDVISGDFNGQTLISVSKVGADNLPGTWVDASTLPTGAALMNKLTNTDGAAYNDVFYVVGGRNVASYFSGTSSADTATADTLSISMAADPNDSGHAASGTLESRIIDLGAITNLKHLTVVGTNLSGNVEVRYRSAAQDGVWSDWYTLDGTDADISGAARYAQWQVVLKGTGASTPTVTSATITTAAGVVAGFTADDVKRALTLAAGLDKAAQADMDRLDIVKDGAINVLDAAKIQRQINGK